MPVHLHAINTWTPETVYAQAEAAELLQTQFEDKRTRRILRHIYRHSEIDTRHSAVTAFGGADPAGLFHDPGGGRWRNPGTGDRNQLYTKVSKTASVQLARQTLADAPGVAAADITHVITASCTGFYTPGPDHFIVRELGLAPGVERFHLGFMGCYAAFPALRMAHTICTARPEAVVLIQCLELCSLHLQLNTDDPEALVSASLFADGAGAALVSARPPAPGGPAYKIDALSSTLIPEGETDMAWEIGNHGYEIVLSSYVPRILGLHIRDTLAPRLAESGWTPEDVGFWAVHPGGKAILDRVAEALELPGDALQIARDVLRRHGNMSSATIFFLLREGLRHYPSGTRTAAMAFGPGLTVETAFLQRCLA